MHGLNTARQFRFLREKLYSQCFDCLIWSSVCVVPPVFSSIIKERVFAQSTIHRLVIGASAFCKYIERNICEAGSCDFCLGGRKLVQTDVLEILLGCVMDQADYFTFPIDSNQSGAYCNQCLFVR